MLNILFLINHAGKAGTERYVQTLVEGAARFGAAPFFAYNEPGPLLDKLLGLGVPCRRVAMRNPFDLAAARALAGVCGEFGIGLIHTNYLRENYIAVFSRAFAKKKPAVAYTNHFVVGNGLPVRLANRLVTRADGAIISVCDAGVPLLVRNGNDRRKIAVVRNAVDPQAWKPGEGYAETRARARGQLGIGPGETVFLCASRFAHDKGHKFLIGSLARLAAAHGTENMRVLLAGDGPLLGDARGWVSEAGLGGLVRFVGYAPDLKPLFYASDAYLNPSRHEASSFLIIEALASGLPVIAADMGGNREIVNERNGCGTLVAYGDEGALCEAIQKYRAGGGFLAGLKENALLTVERDFALDGMLKKTYGIFHSCAS